MAIVVKTNKGGGLTVDLNASEVQNLDIMIAAARVSPNPGMRSQLFDRESMLSALISDAATKSNLSMIRLDPARVDAVLAFHREQADPPGPVLRVVPPAKEE